MYWGKIIGTLAGLVTLKPWFVLLGLFLGHQFDKGFVSRYRDFEKQGANLGRVSDDFVRALFQLSTGNRRSPSARASRIARCGALC